MMGIDGFKTKKELKEAIGERPNFIETSMFGSEFNGDGVYNVVGPSPYKRVWYATVTIRGGLIAAVQ